MIDYRIGESLSIGNVRPETSIRLQSIMEPKLWKVRVDSASKGIDFKMADYRIRWKQRHFFENDQSKVGQMPTEIDFVRIQHDGHFYFARIRRRRDGRPLHKTRRVGIESSSSSSWILLFLDRRSKPINGERVSFDAGVDRRRRTWTEIFSLVFFYVSGYSFFVFEVEMNRIVIGLSRSISITSRANQVLPSIWLDSVAVVGLGVISEALV